ncbi:MAG: hypothetical protein QOE71_3283 [Pseudonocardiales bacterium]|nr:hypothetical protein [Pseudonocardiales bacterium]
MTSGMTMPDFLLPDLGEGLTEAEIVGWHVQIGDRVEIDQIVVEVETAKAAVEVPIPFAGVVDVLHAQPGETVAVGAPLISVTARPKRAPDEGFGEPGLITPTVSTTEQADEGSGNVLIGYGTPNRTARRRRGPRRTPHQAQVAAVNGSAIAATPPASGRAIAVISPLVRKIARDADIDLGVVEGTGPAGLVLRRDVEQAISQGAAQTEPGTSPPDSTAVSNESAGPIDTEQRIPIKGLRKIVADKLSRSRREIPEATVWVDVDATGLLAARAELNRREEERPVSVLALLARFAILGLRRYPELNGRIEADEIVMPTQVHLGFAAQTERGLVVPVVRDAHRLATRDLSAAISRHTSSARAGSLTPAELSGGTFTVNNYGVFGVDGSAAIINHPEVAILGIGRIIDRPWVHNGELAIRKLTQLTLAFDHRVCDGATAGGFLRFVADCVESPVLALGEL